MKGIIAAGVVIVAAWWLIANTDWIRTRPRVEGLTTLDSKALARADSLAADSIAALAPPPMATLDPLDSMMAAMPGMMPPFDSLAMPPLAMTEQAKIDTRPDRLIVEVQIPNLKEGSLHIEAKRQRLEISGEQRTVQETKDASGRVVSRSESSSSYTTSFGLPEPVKPDGLKSRYEDGRLIIEIPRLHSEA